MQVLLTMFLAVLAAFSSNVEPVSAQKSADASSPDESVSSEELRQQEKARQEYGETLEKLVGLDIREILEEARRRYHPTAEEKHTKARAEAKMLQPAIFKRGGFRPDRLSDKDNVALLGRFKLPYGKFEGSFPLKDGNIAYFFSLKVAKEDGTGMRFIPGVREGRGVTGEIIRDSDGENSWYSMQPGPGYVTGKEPKYEPIPKSPGPPGDYTCETYLVTDPSDKVFFWSHKGDWPGCSKGHRGDGN